MEELWRIYEYMKNIPYLEAGKTELIKYEIRDSRIMSEMA